MFKLMKYEFQKQMFSKVIIAIILGVLAAYFGLMCILDKSEHAGIAIILMFFVMICAGFYVAIESLSVYEKDLKTKRSYMLFLVPQSSYKILGAKMIAAILQIFFTMAIYGTVIALCGAIFLIKYSSVKELLEMIQQIFEISFDIHIDYLMAVRVLVTIFVLWVFIVMLGIFTNTLINTILTKSKLISFLVAVVYILLFWAVMQIDNGMYDMMEAANMSMVFMQVIELAFYGVIDIILYIASAWLIDKKLSV